MTIKSVSFTILDHQLGANPNIGTQTQVVIGVSSTGTADVAFESSAPSDFVDEFGYGPGPQLAGYIANQSGAPVIFVKAATVSNGTANPVVHTGTGASAMTLTGTPVDTAYLVVTVVTGGTIGTAGCVIEVSLDAGRTVYRTVTLGVATTYAVPNTGITLNFTTATLVADDTYTAVLTEPLWSDATVTSAFTGLLTSSTAFKNVIVTGPASATNAANYGSNATTLFGKKRFTRVFGNARDATWGGTSTETSSAWITSISADYASFADERVSISAGEYNTVSPIDSTQYRRPLSWAAAAIDAQTNIGQDISEVAIGALPILGRPATPDGFIYYDAQQTPALDSARFLTAQQLFGLQGWYMTNSNMMASTGSDFSILPYCEVVDETCYAAYLFLVQKLGGSVRVDKTNGNILDADAKDIENRLTSALVTALGNGVSSVQAVVTRNNNILATKQLKVTISIVPLGYIGSIDVTVTFVNPAIALTA